MVDIESEQDEIGLCRKCTHAQFIKSAKGSVFILCTLSKTDPSFPKYPRLPILSCPGYREKEIKQQTQEQ